MKIEHALEIAAPVARVWALTVAVEGWPAVTPTVTGVERLDAGPLQVGSRVRLEQPGQPPRVWTVTALEPERRFAWATRMLGVEMTGVHELEGTERGTRNVLRVELRGWSSWLVGALLRVPIARAIAQENEGFRRAATAAD
ncbi:MAG: SRPBCC family protein [Planctomycetota bacterium]